MIPQVEKIDLDLKPLEFFLSIPQHVQDLSALFSDGSKDSRWSLFAWDPVEKLSFSQQSQSSQLTEIFKRRSLDGFEDLPFVGGAIGTIDYEYGLELLSIPVGTRRGATPQECPLVTFSFYDQAFLYDHHEDQWWGINRTGNDLECLNIQDFVEFVETQDLASLQILRNPAWNFERYKKSFDILHKNIRLGEIYQACLTFPFRGQALDHPRRSFVQQFQRHPAPMSAYLEQDHRIVLSFSPERFLHWDGDILETKPIKGTRPRGTSAQEDDRLKQELLEDEKEQAELNMITDLLRNDMARVSKPGSVKVLEHQSLQELPSVWHTFSHIQSHTKEGIDAWHILEGMFPGGSISGCPKRRAVELLREVEEKDRGLYTGCIGYISDHQKMDLNIAIRTLVQTQQDISAGFGGGIVYDSQVEKEFQECFDKAQAFIRPSEPKP